jgi:predicted HAD superfamily Cof-like phosphohydrolase
MVRQFFHIANQAQPRTPAVPDDETVRFRLRLIAEEFFELLESGFDVWEAKEVDWALGHVIDIITHAKIKVDMAEMADALGDIEFTTNGMAIAFGVDTDPLWEAVSAANNSKAGGPVVNGKLMKPDGFEPPPIGALLEAQGWKP